MQAKSFCLCCCCSLFAYALLKASVLWISYSCTGRMVSSGFEIQAEFPDFWKSTLSHSFSNPHTIFGKLVQSMLCRQLTCSVIWQVDEIEDQYAACCRYLGPAVDARLPTLDCLLRSSCNQRQPWKEQQKVSAQQALNKPMLAWEGHLAIIYGLIKECLYVKGACVLDMHFRCE